VSLLEQHPRYKAWRAELEKAQEASRKFMTKQAARTAEYVEAMQEWEAASLRAAMDDSDPPPKPEEPESKEVNGIPISRILMMEVQKVEQQRNAVLAEIEPEIAEQAQRIQAQHRPDIYRLVTELEEIRKELGQVVADVNQVEAARANAEGRRFTPPPSLSLEDLLTGRSVLEPRSIDTRSLGVSV
jgi:hypothetical protein